LAVVAPPSRTTTPVRNGLGSRAIIAADRGIYQIAQHWLLVLNLLALPLAILPVVAAALQSAGNQALAKPIYAFFALTCHQRDDRTFHVYGEKMACCQRCFAIYGGFFAIGVLFVYLRTTLPDLRPLRPVWLLALCGPLVLDGLLQLTSTWDSTWYLRVATGLLFAIAVSWFLLPYLERGFAQMRRDLERLFARLVSQGRARPLSGAPTVQPPQSG
jgi:uncharacterized membrane protein